MILMLGHRLRRWPNIKSSLIHTHCWSQSSTPATTRRRTNVGLMLVQRRRWLANIKPALVQILVISGT